MNPPMINSTSSVSTTKKKREAERSVNWTVEETQVLLCAWSDERVQKSLAENLRNRHVFKHLSARMSEMGFSRSPHQCRLRVKTLKANYVRAKLQRSVDSSQPCSFKYFAEMDAVLGRRSAMMEGGPYFISPDRLSGIHLDPIDRTGGMPPDLNSNTEIGIHSYGSLGRAGRGCHSWQLESEVKLENRDDSTDEFEFSDAGFTSHHPRERHHEVYLDSSMHPEASGSPIENSLSTPSPHIVVVPPPPVPPPPVPPLHPLTLPQPSASPLPPSPDPSPIPVPLPTSDHHHQQHPPPESSSTSSSSCLEPALKHLSECFQRLVSETRGLLVQLESQRQEQAHWHRELLADWLQREERRQREAAEREERRETARMEHEIRVLELLTGIAREQGCRCGGTLTGPNHTITKEDGH